MERSVFGLPVTDAALSFAHLQYDLSTSRFGSRARGCWLGGEIGPAEMLEGPPRPGSPSSFSRVPFAPATLSNKLRYPCCAAHGRDWPDSDDLGVAQVVGYLGYSGRDAGLNLPTRSLVSITPI